MIQFPASQANVVETFASIPTEFDPSCLQGGNLGYTPNPEATERYAASQSLEVLANSPWYGDMRQERRDAFLWLPLLGQLPRWLRGNQGIGDCVAWGWELGVLLYLYGLRQLGQIDFPLVTGCTEAIYGGARVEAAGGSLGGYRDGAFGGYAAKWLSEWGYLLRLDYSEITGVAEHNVKKYLAEKAKAWGHYGCGGQGDGGRGKGLLDLRAMLYPIQTTAIRDTTQLAAALENGYPCPTCSNVGFGNRGRFHVARDSQGLADVGMSANHCELYAGVRWVKGRPEFRRMGSWGKHCSGPDPGIDHEAVSFCGYWVNERSAQKTLNSRDTFAITGSEGFVPRKLDWTNVRTAANSDRLPSGPSWV